MPLTHLNPDTLHANPAFSQGVRLGAGDLVVVGGQNGVDADGAFVSDDLGEQARQAFRNVLAVLAEVGADQTRVGRLTVYLVAGQDVRAGFGAAAEVWGDHPTAISVLQVAALARPEALVEIDALAVVPSA